MGLLVLKEDISGNLRNKNELQQEIKLTRFLWYFTKTQNTLLANIFSCTDIIVLAYYITQLQKPFTMSVSAYKNDVHE